MRAPDCLERLSPVGPQERAGPGPPLKDTQGLGRGPERKVSLSGVPAIIAKLAWRRALGAEDVQGC
jgi:hypothetical protein